MIQKIYVKKNQMIQGKIKGVSEKAKNLILRI
jgi:hypothetical protein